MGARGRKSASELAVVRLQPASDAALPVGVRPEPPGHLSPATKDWWRTTVRDYDLEPHHLRLLQGAAESWDRYQQARVALAKHGLTFTDDKGMVRARPEVAIERDSRIAFARLIRELDLDVEAPAEARSRPPALRSNRG
jgi:phage terminase small subunit